MSTNQRMYELIKYLCKKHNAEVINKASATEMKLIGWALDLMGVVDKEYFLNNFATTIGNNIYLPFSIEKPTKRQIEVFVHELHHTRQFQRNPKMPSQYILSSAKRAHFEARAMECDLEMHWYFYKKLLNIDALAYNLKFYGCTKTDINTVKKHLKSVAVTIKHGGIHNKVSKDAINWLQKNR